jgi:hypothetical protein
MDTRATNQLYRKVLDLLFLVSILTFFGYVLVPVVGGAEDYLDYFDPSCCGGLVCMSAAFGGLGGRLVVGASGESGGSLGSRAAEAFGASRLDKSDTVGADNVLLTYLLSLLGLGWGLYGTLGGGTGGVVGVSFIMAAVVIGSYLYPIVMEGGLFRRGSGLIYLFFQLPDCNASLIGFGFLPVSLFVWFVATFLQEVTIEVEALSAMRPRYGIEGRKSPCGVERVLSVPLPFRVLPFGLSPLCYLGPLVSVGGSAPPTVLFLVVGCVGFFLGFGSYLAGGPGGVRSWSPLIVSDRLSSMGYYLPGEAPGESTERSLTRLMVRLALASGLLMSFLSLFLAFWVRFLMPEGLLDEGMFAVFRLAYSSYYFSDVVDRARNYFRLASD